MNFRDNDRVRGRLYPNIVGYADLAVPRIPPYISVFERPNRGGRQLAFAPSEWFEKDPEPLKETVPMSVLIEASREAYSYSHLLPDSAISPALQVALRKRGYGTNDGS
jgi:hypothetical protein